MRPSYTATRTASRFAVQKFGSEVRTQLRKTSNGNPLPGGTSFYLTGALRKLVLGRKVDWHHAGASKKPQLPVLPVCNALLAELSKQGRWREALAVLDEMCALELKPDLVSYLKSYSATIAALKRGGKIKKALEVLQHMKKNGVAPSIVTYNTLIAACRRAGDLRTAAALLAEASCNLELDTITYSSLISCCEKSGDWELVLKLLRKVPKPNVITFNAAISVLEKATQWRAALQVLEEEMPKKHVRPDVITFNSCITACGNAGRVEKALELFKMMKRPESTVRPNAVTYCAVVSACERVGDFEKAMEHLEIMKKRVAKGDPNYVVGYNAAISACEKAGEWELAVGLLGELVSAGIADVVSFSAAISACQKGRKANKALELLDLMSKSGTCDNLKPNLITYNSAIAAAEEEADDFATVLRLLREMERACARALTVESENFLSQSDVVGGGCVFTLARFGIGLQVDFVEALRGRLSSLSHFSSAELGLLWHGLGLDGGYLEKSDLEVRAFLAEVSVKSFVKDWPSRTNLNHWVQVVNGIQS